MSALDRQAQTWHELWSVECAYWADVDLNGGLEASGFYTEDGVFDVGTAGGRYTGQAEIAGFYERRRNRGMRTSVHLVHNFCLLDFDQSRAHARGYMVLYADDGGPPVPTGSPGIISLCDNHFARIDGRWLIAERTCTTLFLGDDQPMFGAADNNDLTG